jgi:hypothetical protein
MNKAKYHTTFVGSQLSGSPSLADQRHEGHVGQKIDGSARTPST